MLGRLPHPGHPLPPDGSGSTAGNGPVKTEDCITGATMPLALNSQFLIVYFSALHTLGQIVA
jgi:hypothetical protein